MQIRKPGYRNKQPAQPKPPPEQPEPAERAEDLRQLFSDVENPKQVKFLVAYLQSKRLTDAQRISRVHRHSHYKWLENDPKYPAYFRRARMIIADELEDDAYQRAFVGIDVPIYYHGRLIGTYKVYADKLAMFMLKRMLPEKYGAKVDLEVPDHPPGPRITIQYEGEDKPWEPDLSHCPRYEGD